MRRTGSHGGSMRTAACAAALFAIALSAALIAPTLALAEGPTPQTESAPANTEAPKVTGTPVVGQVLSCSTGGWSNNPTSFSYAWLRSGAPIAGQTGSSYVVQAADVGHTISCAVTASNSGGSYTIGGLPSGAYKVSFAPGAEGVNYIGQYYNGKSQSAEANNVSVTSPNTTGGINAELHAGGRISGTVTNVVTKAPVVEAEVCAKGELAGKIVVGGCAFTASNGTYTIPDLPSASYTVYFEVFFPESAEDQYAPQYYDGKVSLGEAQPVAVTAGSTVSGIDAELQPRDENGRITGKVTSGGKPLDEIEVCVSPANAEEYFEYYEPCVLTNANGEYTLAGLAETEYVVYFEAINCLTGGCKQENYVSQFYGGSFLYESATHVGVKKSATTEKINAELTEGGFIKGVVTNASGGSPIGDMEVCAYGIKAILGVENCEVTNGKGEYTLQALAAGEYHVEFSGGSDYVYQYYNDKSQETAEVVKVTAAKATTSGIDAKMVEEGEVAGRVTSAATGSPLRDVDACAGAGGFEYSCGITNANGEYTIKGLSKATYEVVFSDREEGTDYLPETVSGVSVTEGAVKSGVNAELHPGGEIGGTVTDASTHAGIGKITVCAEQNEVSVACVLTTVGGGSSGSATSAAVTVSGGTFTLTKTSFDAKSDDVDFFFSFPTAGKLSWSLFFRNADVGFADSLGISLGEESAIAQVAKKGGKGKSKRCKKSQTRHKGKCVATLVSFASGSQTVPAGTVEVKVHAGAKAVKALKSGHTLHVSGTFTFQSALGGAPVSHTESVIIKAPRKKAAKKHGKGKGR